MTGLERNDSQSANHGYDKEVGHSTEAELEQEKSGFKNLKKSKARKTIRYYVLLLFLLLVAISGICYLQYQRIYGKYIPVSMRHQLKFPLYYPTRLPNGYNVDKSSFKIQDKTVLIFSVLTPNGKNAAVTEEAVPTNTPTHQTSNSPIQIPGEANFTAPIGQAHVGLWGDKYVADIVTPQTWIIINSTGLTLDQAKAVALSFTPL
jgi:cytoskeletal protein RodZ